MQSRLRISPPLFLLSFLLVSPVAVAFECPVPEASSPYVLQESKPDQQRLSQLLSSSDLENRIGVIVTDLRRTYPTVARYEIVNYMVGAYCPVVRAMPGLTDAEKTQRVETFAESVFDLLARQQL